MKLKLAAKNLFSEYPQNEQKSEKYSKTNSMKNDKTVGKTSHRQNRDSSKKLSTTQKKRKGVGNVSKSIFKIDPQHHQR